LTAVAWREQFRTFGTILVDGVRERRRAVKANGWFPGAQSRVFDASGPIAGRSRFQASEAAHAPLRGARGDEDLDGRSGACRSPTYPMKRSWPASRPCVPTSVGRWLERARDLMRHRNPAGDLAVVVERALDALLAQLEKERLGKTARPRSTAQAGATALPGASAQSNLRVRCRAHNALRAEEVFGRAHVAAHIHFRHRKLRGEAPAPAEPTL
jgi:hypothetical protein